MISIIEREVVDRYHWLDKAEFLDLLAVAQSLPGIMAVNIAVVVGDKLRGLKGALSAAAGTIMPSFLIILLIAIFLTPETIIENPTLSAIFKGIRPVSRPLPSPRSSPLPRSAGSAGRWPGFRLSWHC